jgi:hypothetical protein
MSWVPISLGTSCEGNQHRDMLIESVPLKYPQYELETYTFMSMASALHYYSSTMDMGDKQLASTLAQGAAGYVKGKNAHAQLDILVKLVSEKSTYFQKYELRAKKTKAEELDILYRKSPWPTVVVLLGTDGGMSHSVTIVNDLVFDSNCSYAMRLIKETLDWCCNCTNSFKRATYAVHFWK